MRTDPSVNSGQPFYYADDHEGSVTHLLSSAGAILEHYRYDVFGAPSIEDANGNTLTPPASAYNNRFMFTGREYTATFGVYEYRARAYHPGLGRFTGEDPKGFDAGDYNMFRYCHNDPEDITDPTGLGYENNVDYPRDSIFYAAGPFCLAAAGAPPGDTEPKDRARLRSDPDRRLG